MGLEMRAVRSGEGLGGVGKGLPQCLPLVIILLTSVVDHSHNVRVVMLSRKAKYFLNKFASYTRFEDLI